MIIRRPVTDPLTDSLTALPEDRRAEALRRFNILRQHCARCKGGRPDISALGLPDLQEHRDLMPGNGGYHLNWSS